MKDLGIYTTGNNSSLINDVYSENNSTFATPVYISKRINQSKNLIIEPTNVHIKNLEIKK